MIFVKIFETWARDLFANRSRGWFFTQRQCFCTRRARGCYPFEHANKKDEGRRFESSRGGAKSEIARLLSAYLNSWSSP